MVLNNCLSSDKTRDIFLGFFCLLYLLLFKLDCFEDNDSSMSYVLLIFLGNIVNFIGFSLHPYCFKNEFSGGIDIVYGGKETGMRVFVKKS